MATPTSSQYASSYHLPQRPSQAPAAGPGAAAPPPAAPAAAGLMAPDQPPMDASGQASQLGLPPQVNAYAAPLPTYTVPPPASPAPAPTQPAPAQPAAAAPTDITVPAYAETFGAASYVKSATDPQLLALSQAAIARAPELGATPFGQAVAAGQVGPTEVNQLQTFLEGKGYSVGPKGADGKYGPNTHQGLSDFLGGKPVAPAPTPADGPAVGPVDGLGQTRDGLTIPGGGAGKATTFWNGHIAYKGEYDMYNRQNAGKGAWGDDCKPTDYFVALPVSSRAWHNQKILVTNPQTGQQVVARVQDKGPAARTGAAIDLSPVTMEALGGRFDGSMGNVRFEFAPADAPVGPVR